MITTALSVQRLDWHNRSKSASTTPAPRKHLLNNNTPRYHNSSLTVLTLGLLPGRQLGGGIPHHGDRRRTQAGLGPNVS